MQLEDFITIKIENGIAICWVDHKLEKMNIVSKEAISLVAQLPELIENNDDIKAAILISAKKDFMAGADIKSFEIEKVGDFRPTQEIGHQTLARMEKSKKPYIAAIQGSCVGLGTELVLACHYRIAAKDANTKMALPEVQIGILPGGGGTQRLPRLIGIQKALDMMLTGKQIDMHRAKKWGLVDDVTDRSKLLQASKKIAKKLMEQPYERKSKLSFKDKILESPLGRSLIFSQARKMALKKSQGNYPAIPYIIDCVEAGIKKGQKAGYQKELDHFEELLLTPESKSLRSIFFASTKNKTNPYKGAKKINQIGIIGAGFMGAGIAELCALKGMNVTLKDIHEKTLYKAKENIWKAISKKLKRKQITKLSAQILINNVNLQLEYEQLAHSDIVIEAVLEIMDLKKKIIRDIEKHGKEDIIIASNTSSLSLTEMAKHAKKPERLIGMHYFSPVPKMPLLEIVKTEKTDPAVIATCYDIGLKQGKTVIVVNDCPGFYVNRILGPYTNESLMMIDEGLSIEKVDKALLKKGMPVGPATLADEVGLDIVAHVTESTMDFVQQREGVEVCMGVIKMNKAGLKGRKSRKGFFNYDDSGKRTGLNEEAYQYFNGNGKNDMSIVKIQDRAILSLANEAARCLEDKIIASPTDGDLGAIFGIGFMPFTGGPFRMMDTIGIQNLVNKLYALSDEFGVRFKPAKILIDMAAKGKTFY